MPQIIDVPGEGLIEFPDGMSDADISTALKGLQAKQEKKTSLMGQLSTERSKGEIAQNVAGGLGYLQNQVVEPLTPSGLMNQPTRLTGVATGKAIPDIYQANKPVVNFPESEGTGVGAGVERVGAHLLSGFTTPESIVTLPAAGASAVIRAIFAGQMASQLPEQSKNALRVLQDPNSTKADKVAAVGDPVVSAAMIKAITSVHESKPALPTAADAIKQLSRQIKEAKLPEQAGQVKVAGALPTEQSGQVIPNIVSGKEPSFQTGEMKRVVRNQPSPPKNKPIIPMTLPEEDREEYLKEPAPPEVVKGVPVDQLPQAMKDLSDTMADLKEKIRASGFQPDPTALKVIDAVSNVAAKKQPKLSESYGALEAVPTVKKMITGIISRFEQEGRDDETKPFYDHLQHIEDFENRYVEGITAPGVVRGRAKTSDIISPKPLVSVSNASQAALDKLKASLPPEQAKAAVQPLQEAGKPSIESVKPQPTQENAYQIQSSVESPSNPSPKPSEEMAKGAPGEIQQPATAQSKERISPSELRPALLVDGKPVIGGDTHSKIAVQSQKNLLAAKDDANHVFVDTKGNVYDREQAAQAVGRPDIGKLTSGVLKDLKAQKPKKSGPITEPMKTTGETPEIAQKTPVSGPVSKPVETPAQATDKVSQHLQSVKQTEGTRSAKDIKNELIDRLETAIMKAPVESNEKVTIEIPGDGTFTINNTQSALRGVLARAKKIKTDFKQEKTPVGKIQKQVGGVGILNGPTDINKGALGNVGMGAAKPAEFGEGGHGRDVYGIAARVRDERARAGQAEPVGTGKGVSAPDSVLHGRQLIANGFDVEGAMQDFERTKAVSSDAMAASRAHGEQLAKAASNIETKFGTDSNEYRLALKALTEWDARIKVMQTEWHKTGQAQQGETDIDTGTFTGLAREFTRDTGREFTPQQEKSAKKIAKGVTEASSKEEEARQRLYKTMDEETGTKTPPASEKPPIEAPESLEDARKVFGDHKKGKVLTPEQVKTLWKRAKVYLENGESDFHNIRQKLAIEFGVPKEDVTKGLAQPKGAKRLTDYLYAKMSERRRLVNQAKTWLKNQAMPGWLRFTKAVPRVFFIAKIIGHGTVGMITHAGLNIFNPSAWATYWPNFFRQYKLWLSPAYHERMMQDLIRNPNFVKAKRAGLVNDPFTYKEDYNNAFSHMFHNLELGGQRGFDALKLFRQARFDQIWDKAPDSLKTPEYAKMIADGINHATGVVKASVGGEWVSAALFAPKLEASRWAWMIADPLKAAKTMADWKNSTPQQRAAAISEVKQKAYIAGTYFTLLAINQGLLSASDSKDKVNFTDPRRKDFLAFKGAGHQLGIVSPMIGTVWLLANLMHTSALTNRSKFEKLSNEDQQAGSILLQYARGKASPFAQQVGNIFWGKDVMERPLPFSKDELTKFQKQNRITKYTWPEYVSEQFAPIPFEEALTEVWRDQGMSDSQIKIWIKGLTVGALMGATGARISTDMHQKK